jgi:hypothetical protein
MELDDGIARFVHNPAMQILAPLLRALLLVFVATFCFAQDTAQLDPIVQTYVQNKTFMGSVLVARGADVLLSKGYGPLTSNGTSRTHRRRNSGSGRSPSNSRPRRSCCSSNVAH